MNTMEILKEAILNAHPVLFMYRGRRRFVEPHHYGILNNIPQLHGYQFAGSSQRGYLPQWRNFKLHLIRDIQIDRDHRFKVKKNYNPNAHYTEIYCGINHLPH